MRWEIIIDRLPLFLKGALLTIELTVLAVAIGTVIGLFASLLRLSKFSVLRLLAATYIDFFRGTPLLVQIMIIHFGLPDLFGYTPHAWVDGVIALSINSGAYIVEIFRGGIQSIDNGQMEASRSLGMSYGQSMINVILPQAFKRIIPPLGNEFIAMLKDSSLVSVISIQELMLTGRTIVGSTSRTFEPYITIAIIYLIMTLSISRLVAYMERRLKTSDTH